MPRPPSDPPRVVAWTFCSVYTVQVFTRSVWAQQRAGSRGSSRSIGGALTVHTTDGQSIRRSACCGKRGQADECSGQGVGRNDRHRDPIEKPAQAGSRGVVVGGRSGFCTRPLDGSIVSPGWRAARFPGLSAPPSRGGESALTRCESLCSTSRTTTARYWDTTAHTHTRAVSPRISRMLVERVRWWASERGITRRLTNAHPNPSSLDSTRERWCSDRLGSHARGLTSRRVRAASTGPSRVCAFGRCVFHPQGPETNTRVERSISTMCARGVFGTAFLHDSRRPCGCVRSVRLVFDGEYSLGVWSSTPHSARQRVVVWTLSHGARVYTGSNALAPSTLHPLGSSAN
jgi:hypothetical protein